MMAMSSRSRRFKNTSVCTVLGPGLVVLGGEVGLADRVAAVEHAHADLLASVGM